MTEIEHGHSTPASKTARAAVVVAAGRGERAGQSTEGPKQYRKIGGLAVITHTLRQLLADMRLTKIVVVIHPDDHALFAAAASDLQRRDVLTTVDGGATRQASVLAGLRALTDDNVDAALIHDGVRPFLDNRLLDEIHSRLDAGEHAVLPGLPVTDTLKRVSSDDIVAATVARENLHAAQTPQAFNFQDILAAHEAAEEQTDQIFTDDASIAEWWGLDVQLVTGSPDNVKLTTQRDIEMADGKLSHTPRVADIRTGNGYDVHQLVDGSSVWLCGVEIPHTRSLSGHSDADVGLHALTDALLATCGAGDIGDHFPPTDPKWKGASSDIFLRHAANLVAENGGTILNADITLIAEAPKIGPHRQTMRERLSEILNIEITRCSVKATTNEMIGFIGRQEGIAAIATSTVSYGETNV